MDVLCVILILIILFPYSFIGDNISAIFAGILGTIYFLVKIRKSSHKLIRVNKKYIVLLILLFVSGILTLCKSNDIIKSIDGLFILYDAFLYYLIFSLNKDKKIKIIKTSLYTILAICIVSVVFQGIILKNRINGLMGYANTFGLLLTVGLYLNHILKNKYTYIFDFVLILGILYTGSRNTMFYLIIFIIYELYNEIKDKEGLNIIIPLAGAALSYVIFGYRNILVILLPFVFLILYEIENIKAVHIKNIILLSICILTTVVAVSNNTNTFQRIKNISIKNPMLQERFVYYEDAVKHILKNPMGSGINTFEYKSAEDQSAYYDVKYIHNSFLQMAYDNGVFGFIIFLLIFIYGLFIIKDSNVIFLYITIFGHSILDFDFSFTVIFIICSMAACFYGKKDYRIKSNLINVICCISIPILFFMLIINTTDFLSQMSIKHNKLNAAENILSFNKCFDSFDVDTNVQYANLYKQFYDNTKDKSFILKSLYYLKKAENINPHDVSIQWNVIYCYVQLDNDEKVIECSDKLLKVEKYNKNVYEFYNDYLNKKYNETKMSKYIDKQNSVKKKYAEALSVINAKSKYMKNQLVK